MLLQLSQRPVTTAPHPWDILQHLDTHFLIIIATKPHALQVSNLVDLTADKMTLSKGEHFDILLTIKKELHSNFQKLLQLSPVSPTSPSTISLAVLLMNSYMGNLKWENQICPLC